MKKKVYYYPLEENNRKDIAEIARNLLEILIRENNIKLEKEIPLKIHPGNPGNTTYIKPENFAGIINYLRENKVSPYFVETNQAPEGARFNEKDHIRIAKEHGFTKIPFVIADGPDGFDHRLIKIAGGKHFRDCKIAEKLADKKQVIVLSHFKGHIMSGFGGAIKMLGLGFASGRGKAEMHSKVNLRDGEPVRWAQFWKLYTGKSFRERSAEYALAASQNKNFIYLNFAVDITANCDCDGRKMGPVYKDLGIFASLDPVAIDRACFDLLKQREGKTPFGGGDIFAYAQKIGLGSSEYEIRQIRNEE